MSDVNIVIAAQDMASSVMKNVAAQTATMTTSVKSMSAGVVTSTRAMSAGFMSLTASIAPLLAAMLSLQAIFAIFQFARDSVLAFVEAGSPAGKQLGESLEIAGQAIQKLMVSVGGLLAPLVNMAAQGLTLLANTASTILAPAIEFMSAAFAATGPIMQGFMQGILTAITAAEVAFGNLGPIMEYAWLSFKLAFSQMIEGTKYTFTTVLPAYIRWFGENGHRILLDAAVAMATVLTNFGKNLGEFAAAIYMWISGGMQNGLDGLMENIGQTMMVGLMDGFEAQTKALPQIAARQATEYEKAISGEMNRIGSNLGDQFNQKFASRMSGLSSELGIGSGTQSPAAEETAKKLSTGLATVATAQASIAQQLSASESRLLTRGQSEGPMQSVATASQKTAEAAEETRKSSDRMVQLLEELLSRNFIVAEAV